jgi:CheY-like chemotaxis protein
VIVEDPGAVALLALVYLERGLTAFAMRGDEDRIRGAGCDTYLSKPITVVSFLKSVAQFLEPVAAA